MRTDPFAEYEAELLEQARKRIAAEDAAWEALPQSEKDRIMAEREAKWAALEDAAHAVQVDEDEDD